MILNTANHGASTNSLGNLFLCVTTHIVKDFFPVSNLNWSSFSLKSLLLVLPLQALVKRLVTLVFQIFFLSLFSSLPLLEGLSRWDSTHSFYMNPIAAIYSSFQMGSVALFHSFSSPWTPLLVTSLIHFHAYLSWFIRTHYPSCCNYLLP